MGPSPFLSIVCRILAQSVCAHRNSNAPDRVTRFPVFFVLRGPPLTGEENHHFERRGCSRTTESNCQCRCKAKWARILEPKSVASNGQHRSCPLFDSKYPIQKRQGLPAEEGYHFDRRGCSRKPSADHRAQVPVLLQGEMGKNSRAKIARLMWPASIIPSFRF